MYPDHPPKVKIRLTGAEATLLGNLFLRAADAHSPDPILGDQYAQRLIDQCDVNFSMDLFDKKEAWIKLLASRTKAIDDWCQV